MHGNLEPEENVWPEWDIEDMKKAFIDNAKGSVSSGSESAELSGKST